MPDVFYRVLNKDDDEMMMMMMMMDSDSVS